MSKLSLKEINDIMRDNAVDVEAMSAARLACGNAFYYMTTARNSSDDVAAFHYGLLQSIDEAISKLESSTFISAKARENNMQYLRILKSKIEKVTELLVFT